MKSALIRWPTAGRSRRDRTCGSLGRLFAPTRCGFTSPAVARAIGTALGSLSLVLGAADFPLRDFSGRFVRHVGLLVAAINSRRRIATIGPGADPFRFANILLAGKQRIHAVNAVAGAGTSGKT